MDKSYSEFHIFEVIVVVIVIMLTCFVVVVVVVFYFKLTSTRKGTFVGPSSTMESACTFASCLYSIFVPL